MGIPTFSFSSVLLFLALAALGDGTFLSAADRKRFGVPEESTAHKVPRLSFWPSLREPAEPTIAPERPSHGNGTLSPSINEESREDVDNQGAGGQSAAHAPTCAASFMELQGRFSQLNLNYQSLDQKFIKLRRDLTHKSTNLSRCQQLKRRNLDLCEEQRRAEIEQMRATQSQLRSVQERLTTCLEAEKCHEAQGDLKATERRLAECERGRQELDSQLTEVKSQLPRQQLSQALYDSAFTYERLYSVLTLEQCADVLQHVNDTQHHASVRFALSACTTIHQLESSLRAFSFGNK